MGPVLNARFVTDMVNAIAEVHAGKGPAVVGTDARTSSAPLGRIAAGTLAMAGLNVIEVGCLPTPAIQYNVTRLRAGFAVVVTASHNPPEFNGLKGIAADGLEFTPPVERAVEAAYDAHKAPTRAYNEIGHISVDSLSADRYLEGITAQVDRSAIARRNFRVVLDCGNGASCGTSPRLLASLGCRTSTLNANPDGLFPGHASEPTEANLKDLVESVVRMGAHFGVAHDGDADRAVFVDEKGRYLPGEKILSLCAREEVRTAGGGLVVTPVTSSDSVAEVIAPFGGKVEYTRVGSPVVTRAMMETRAVFGGEENGGAIFPRFQLARDGAMTLAKVLEILARSSKPLSALIDELPPYFLVKRKLPCPSALQKQILGQLPSLFDQGQDAKTEITTLDGVKVRDSRGWVLVRPSGTEPLYRIFAEARDPAVAEELASSTMKRVEGLIRKASSSA